MTFFATIALGIGLLISISNWAAFFQSRRGKTPSLAPLIGGILLAFGLAGFEASRPYWWLAIFIDAGTLVMLIAVPHIVFQAWRSARRKVEHSFKCVDGNRTIAIQLCENGDASITISCHPPQPEVTRGNFISSIGFSGKWIVEGDHFVVNNYASGRRLLMKQSGDGFDLLETYPESAKAEMHSIDGLRIDRNRDL